MSDKNRNGSVVSEAGRNRAMGDGGSGESAQRVASTARSRQSLASRHDSTAAYGRFAVDASLDLYDGLLPMEVTKEVAKVDATHQRKIEHDLRVKAFAHMVGSKGTAALVE